MNSSGLCTWACSYMRKGLPYLRAYIIHRICNTWTPISLAPRPHTVKASCYGPRVQVLRCNSTEACSPSPNSFGYKKVLAHSEWGNQGKPKEATLAMTPLHVIDFRNHHSLTMLAWYATSVQVELSPLTIILGQSKVVVSPEMSRLMLQKSLALTDQKRNCWTSAPLKTWPYAFRHNCQHLEGPTVTGPNKQ